MTPAQLAEVEAWLAQVDLTVARLDAGTVAAILAAYEVIDDWENPSQTLPAASAAVAAGLAGRQAVAEAGAQLAAVTTAILRGAPVAGSIAPSTAAYPRNAEPFDVYSRPIHVYRDALARGLDEQMAQIEAFQRAEMLAMTDNLLARRDAAIEQLRRDEVFHYRRVIRPELSKTGTCGLCIAAASRVYTTDDLMPIHTRCKCDVVPIIGADDPGERFNLADMKQLYSELDATRKEDLIRYRYTIDENGELGPLLAPDGGRGDVGDPTTSPLGFEQQSAEWVREQIAITETLKESAWQVEQLKRLRERLAALADIAA